ncbi:hypothetical protein BU24DRAFT_450276 [Aaosphaeria arxii CBS 175.79]|uniref:Uncharacterized protein n=1 Tax=Aaosphaeria arxii CBS 175.79 TaxID=1450172 RepID=A0A6A5XSB7_9PLEO|nr:uncharacterized protein BU24DRAFT_450276 [Aaosphaeria arxii CBS 175.79]KAF2015590.1 hypothetical protein BU24DRAFT_450276 [Aaosphaeria arxii CBS 175.79]
MNAKLAASALIVSFVQANILPRAEPLRTFIVPLPTQAQPFTSTVRGCSDVPPFAVVGVPTGTFRPETITIYGPPQADPTSTTIIDPASNATEVIIITRLQGECASFPLPEPTPTPPKLTGNPTGGAPTGTPTPSAEACPENGCQAKVIRAAQSVIDAINKVTLLSQDLQAAARKIGDPVSKRDLAAAQAPFDDVARGLRGISVTLSVSLPRLTVLPPFPPGCDTDAIVIALIQFVRVHQALLNIIIGRRGVLENSPIRRDTIEDAVLRREPVDLETGGEAAIIGPAIAAGLRAVEGVVDTLAFQILRLVPTRSECAKQQKEAIDGSLSEAITQYES